uniref:Uncharacterized protein n=1 Tax=Anguilla anguilla TaxID=7936 RepID=A0A0E9T7M0_ANGAN
MLVSVVAALLLQQFSCNVSQFKFFIK